MSLMAALAGQGVDRGVWLAQSALMRVDDLVDEVLEAEALRECRTSASMIAPMPP